MALEVNALTVFIAALITAVATGFGALPLAFGRGTDERWHSAGAAVAAGLLTVKEVESRLSGKWRRCGKARGGQSSNAT